MRLFYYPETDSLYVEFQERPSVDTREIGPDIRLDLDEEGRPVGLDIDRASLSLDLKVLETQGLPHCERQRDPSPSPLPQARRCWRLSTSVTNEHRSGRTCTWSAPSPMTARANTSQPRRHRHRSFRGRRLDSGQRACCPNPIRQTGNRQPERRTAHQHRRHSRPPCSR